jgi:hypothetical protein
MRKPDFVWGVLGVLISIYVLVDASTFPADNVLLLGPAFFPMLLAGALLIASLGMIGLTVFTDYGSEYAPFKFKDAGTIRMALSLAVTVGYYFLMPILGFISGTIIYLISLMKLLQVKNNLKVILISIVIAAAVYGVFGMGLNLALPSGLIF